MSLVGIRRHKPFSLHHGASPAQSTASPPRWPPAFRCSSSPIPLPISPSLHLADEEDMGTRGVIPDKWSMRILWACAIGSAISLYMVAVERQMQNRERMMAEGLKEVETGGGSGEQVHPGLTPSSRNIETETMKRHEDLSCYRSMVGRRLGSSLDWSG
ncbi:hypothetical protein Nepgr_027378 [Nepenthes gracilis]|uniref:Uncharacterized protein n=1 Tax=Nepenthes gracilis TaxID=150966 RepID=A0AAD3T8G1_NEPGR|nr:hypothetical protein Nepgr_027378 [Nepenthes gracilis]